MKAPKILLQLHNKHGVALEYCIIVCLVLFGFCILMTTSVLLARKNRESNASQMAEQVSIEQIADDFIYTVEKQYEKDHSSAGSEPSEDSGSNTDPTDPTKATRTAARTTSASVPAPAAFNSAYAGYCTTVTVNPDGATGTGITSYTLKIYSGETAATGTLEVTYEIDVAGNIMSKTYPRFTEEADSD